ncbi:MAG: hypothetical protein EBV84_06070 [Betaproteobacteria bacterium]|nr:hypothetical protein [Betaproteobacteria bacterium]
MPWRARPSSPAVASRDLGRQASTQPLAAELDHSMLAVTLALLLFGLVMVYSASIALPDSPRFAAYKSSHFLLRHAFAIAVGLIAAWIAFRIPSRTMQRLAAPMFLLGLFLLLLVLIPGALTTFALLIHLSPWRRDRIFAYLDPFEPANALGKGYQLSHSLIAFGRGEWFGVGLGGSVEKLHYLPEAHTDFLLAVIGEELGLVGVMATILGFLWMTRRAFQIGRQAIAMERFYPGLVAKGIALWIGAQAFINMGVNLGLLPTKGLTLPLMSYGGTGILVNCVAIGILLRIDRENRITMRGGKL